MIFLTVTIFFASISWYAEGSLISNPMGKFKSISVSGCDVSGDAFNLVSSLKNIDSDGNKALDVTMDLPYDVDTSEYTFSLQVDKFEGGTWREKVYNAQGALCEYISKYIPKVWVKIKKAANPPIEDACILKAAHYELQNFEAQTSDISLPAVLYGKFKLIFKVYSPSDENVMCQIYEVESIK